MMRTDYFATLRRAMVVTQIEDRGVRDPLVLKAMEVVDRRLFVPQMYESDAYSDSPLPIGFGQTISQPYMVALMTEALAIRGGEKVLEVGTGSGYQAALLARMGCKVISIERNPELAKMAARNVERAGFAGSVRIIEGDGTIGLTNEAPFDAIIVTAGAPKVPEPLKKQLRADGGVLVLPVGGQGYQELLKITRRGELYETKDLGCCRFVPLVGEEGW